MVSTPIFHRKDVSGGNSPPACSFVFSWPFNSTPSTPSYLHSGSLGGRHQNGQTQLQERVSRFPFLFADKIMINVFTAKSIFWT